MCIPWIKRIGQRWQLFLSFHSLRFSTKLITKVAVVYNIALEDYMF